MAHSASVKKREALLFDQRALPREAVSLPVLVESHGRQYSARLANLSRIGAIGLPERAGLKFATPVDEADLTYQITRSSAAADRRERRRQESAKAEGSDSEPAPGASALRAVKKAD